LEKVKAEVEAAQLLGLPASYVGETPLPFNVMGAVKFTNQAQFHPRKYILCLAGKIHGGGSYVYENTRVKPWMGKTPAR
jgi:glycine/D-amino acid oxidase-like deaminating enzyme